MKIRLEDNVIPAFLVLVFLIMLCANLFADAGLNWWLVFSPLLFIASCTVLSWGCFAVARWLETPEERASREAREALGRFIKGR